MGAVTFFEMTERERQVLVMTTQDKKNEPNASKMKPEVKVEPKRTCAKGNGFSCLLMLK